MRIPETLSALVDHGIIERVLRPLMSGKEAQIHLIESGGEQRVAKVYKDSQDRTFQNRADYTEGRKVRNSRDQRAMDSRSKHGRAQNEAAWKIAEVDMIYRLRAAGVRVPEPYNFIDGVLIMELVSDAEGLPAPRLGDLTFEPEEATRIFHALLAEVVRMLSAGVVHGDLSDFNVLMSADGPVIIDFPQAVDASSNQNARKLLLRDVDNLHRFHAKFAPGIPPLPYAQEMWELYQRGALAPETQLTGKFRGSKQPVNTEAVLGLIADADHDERRRREKLGRNVRGAAPQARDAQRRPEPHAAQPSAEAPRFTPKQAPPDARHMQRGPRPQADARPRSEPRPQADARPRFEPRPQADARPRFEPRPQADARPRFEPRPQADARPRFEPRPQADARPRFEPRPQAEARPHFEPRPQADVRPRFESRPQADARPRIESRQQPSRQQLSQQQSPRQQQHEPQHARHARVPEAQQRGTKEISSKWGRRSERHPERERPVGEQASGRAHTAEQASQRGGMDGAPEQAPQRGAIRARKQAPSGPAAEQGRATRAPLLDGPLLNDDDARPTRPSRDRR